MSFISSLPGLALRMHVESLGKPCGVNKRSQSLFLVNLMLKDAHPVFSMYVLSSHFYILIFMNLEMNIYVASSTKGNG